MRQTFCPSLDAAAMIYGAVGDFGRRVDVPRRTALTIATHDPDSPISESLVRTVTDYARSLSSLCLSGTPDDVVDQIRELTDQRRRFTHAVFGFELHELPEAQARELLHRCRDLMPEGVLVVADYNLSTATEEEAKKATNSRKEGIQINTYGGFSRWLAAHQRYGRESLRQLIEEAGFPIRLDLPMPAARHLFLASDVAPGDRPL